MSRSLSEIYGEVIKRKAKDPFVRIYGDSSEEWHEFGDFDRDVRRRIAEIHNLDSGGKIFDESRDQSVKVVATASGNTYQHLVTIAAAFLGGYTFCPLSPSESSERLRAKMARVGARRLWTDETQILSEMPEVQRFEGNDGESLNCIELGRRCSNPLALVFTSGSTGESKIVELDESAIVANVESLIQHHRIEGGSTIATSMPVYHVNALFFSFLTGLLSGSRLVFYRRFDPRVVMKSLVEDGVEILSLMPTLLRTLVHPRWSVLRPLGKIPLKYAVSAAAPLSRDLIEDFMAAFNRRIIQGYGLSEAVNFSATMPIDLTDLEYNQWTFEKKFPSIGVPLSCNEMSILDQSGQSLEENQEGEVAICGQNLMRTYRGHQRDEVLRNEILRTGDLGFFERDLKTGRNYFFISGRIKDVIKRNGETVSLRESDEENAKILKGALLLDEDFISVGFGHELAGEELALVVRSSANEELSIEERLSRAFNAHNRDPIFRPRVVLIVRDELRTASGKPQRWRFAEKFKSFKAKVFTQRIEIIRG